MKSQPELINHEKLFQIQNENYLDYNQNPQIHLNLPTISQKYKHPVIPLN